MGQHLKQRVIAVVFRKAIRLVVFACGRIATTKHTKSVSLVITELATVFAGALQRDSLESTRGKSIVGPSATKMAMSRERGYGRTLTNLGLSYSEGFGQRLNHLIAL